MKNMQNFAAQQLTKKQMNDVKGGVDMECQYRDRNGIMRKVWGSGATLGDAKNRLWASVPDYVILVENCVAMGF